MVINMKMYKTLAPVTIRDGLIKLTERQAARRAHLLGKEKPKGVYEVEKELFFKIGEEIGLKDVSKVHLPNLLDLEAQAKEDAKVKADAKKEAEAKAKAEKEAQAKEDAK